ncbi:MAG TPA: hypothetical protein VMH88_01085 [Gemmatimonadales bacterium]|nr:hypothetical protein [Gemmatimonadales bacterium]
MKTLSRRAKTVSAVLTAFVVLGSPTALLASPDRTKVAEAPATEAEPPLPTPPEPAPAAAPVEVVPVPVAPPALPVAPAREATAVAGSPPAPPEPAAVATPVTEIGFQRLPGSAYPEPQTRGLKYSSLWLTFHGLQWPYLPAKIGRDRFVVGLSGWGWLDTSYATFRPWGADSNAVGADTQTYWKQQGRMLLRVTPTYSFDNWFVQGQVELVGTEDQTIERSSVGGADTDDLWLRVGQWNVWDFMIGRFEGWEVFHLGLGLDQNTFERQGAVLSSDFSQIQFYGLTDNQFRPSGAAGNFAIHYYPLPYLRFEGLATVGSAGGGPEVATRPVAILDFGWLKLKGGVEWQRITSQQTTSEAETTSRGVGGAVQFVFEPHIEFGFNAAQGTVEAIGGTGQKDPQNSYTRTSYGGFANFSNGSAKHPVLFGVGGMFTRDVDQNNKANPNIVDNYWLWQSFVAVQYVMFEQLYIKLVGSYSRAHFLEAGTTATVYDDDGYSARLRFSFYF